MDNENEWVRFDMGASFGVFGIDGLASDPPCAIFARREDAVTWMQQNQPDWGCDLEVIEVGAVRGGMWNGLGDPTCSAETLFTQPAG